MKQRPRGFCELGCGTPRTTIKPGPCSPCKSWLYRLSMMSDTALLNFAAEFNRRLRRAEVRMPLARSRALRERRRA